jgi:hypothetical protein
MPEPTEATKACLEYLDKEMTIMGILSTFCVAAAAVVIDRAASADKTSFFKDILTNHPTQVFLGSGFLMVAGLCFYLQRSRLAHYYGSTCISLAAPSATVWSTYRWHVEAYTWGTWIRYRIGFLFLFYTAVIYCNVIAQEIYPKQPYHWIVEGSLFVIVSAVILGRIVILLTHPYSNDPWEDFSSKNFFRDWKNRGEYVGEDPVYNEHSTNIRDDTEQ